MSETTLNLVIQLITAVVVLLNLLLGQNRGQAIARLHKAVDDLKDNGNGGSPPASPPAQ